MDDQHGCESCSAGCTARYTDQRKNEEIGTGLYLLIAGLVIVVLSLVVKLIF